MDHRTERLTEAIRGRSRLGYRTSPLRAVVAIFTWLGGPQAEACTTKSVFLCVARRKISRSHECERGTHECVLHSLHGDCGEAALCHDRRIFQTFGKLKRNVDPPPPSLSPQICPPYRSITRWQMASPI